MHFLFISIYISLHGVYNSLYSNQKCSPYPAAKSLQSCPTLCDPIDGSPPGSAIPGILQARTLEWVAISFSPYPRQVLSNILIFSESLGELMCFLLCIYPL